METAKEGGTSRSWKDRLLGTGLKTEEMRKVPSLLDEDDDFDLFEEDIFRSQVNGVLAIDFSKRVNRLSIKDMELTVIVKLPGRNIGYIPLQNKISLLWKPAKPFRLMDIENR